MKVFRRKLAFLLVLVLAATLALTACGSKSTETEKKVLRVGMECAYPPFNWTQMDDSDGAVPIGDGTYAGGYDVEIAKLVAEHMGMELEIVKTEWDGLPPGVTSGKIDLIIAGMTADDERRQTLDFSEQYYVSDLVVVVHKDSPYASAASINDFAGARITGQLNTLHYAVIDQMEGVNKQNAFEDFPTMTVAVTSGKIDGYVSERPGALSAIGANPDLTFVDFAEGQGFDYTTGDVSVSIGMAKGSDLMDGVNEALAAISEEDRQTLMENAVQNQPLSE